MRRISAPLQGLAFMLAATAIFACMAVCNKVLLARGTPLSLLNLSRAAFTMLLLAPLLFGRRAPTLAMRRFGPSPWPWPRGGGGDDLSLPSRLFRSPK